VTQLLVWQWGRRGGAPRFASLLADGLRALPSVNVALSLARGAEILRGANPPRCELPVTTYASAVGFIGRAALTPILVPRLVRSVRRLHLDLAICAQTGPLDLQMAAALRRLHVPFVVVVHDAVSHPGDGRPFEMTLQRALCRHAQGVVALTGHVAEQLRRGGVAGTDRHPPLYVAAHPPVVFEPLPAPPLTHGGPLRLLSFGRLLPYKGLDLLADALTMVGSRPDVEIRVVGSGPECAELGRLRSLPGVRVENRWVPEDEIGSLLGWADALVLSYTEASQSGVAAAALAAGRRVVATRVGGLAEQLRDQQLATLCDVTADALAAALRCLLTAPLPASPERVDSGTAWRDMAAGVMRWVAKEVR
jgi:glycosyltransferase involved in cell wall biosynthesis